MRRREFIGALGTAAAWPITARAQRPTMPTIGFLNSLSPQPLEHMVNAFRQGLSETGYAEGRNVMIEFRWAHGQYDRLPGLAADLVSRGVALIVAGGGELPGVAAKAATSSIPIVFAMGDDPVKLGLVTSLSRPGGNVTGISFFANSLEAKRLEILRKIVPKATTVAMLVNPTHPNAETQVRDVREAARSVGMRVHVLDARNTGDLGVAFTRLAQLGVDSFFVSSDPFLTSRRNEIVAEVARQRIPASYGQREFAVAGGLMSYGNDLADTYRQLGVYAGRVLNGEKPADLPVMQPTKFQLVVNLKTAKALGVTVPALLLATADEVIE